MSAYDFVVGCNLPVFDFRLCVDAAELTMEYVFITEDGQQIFYSEDGEKFRPDNL